MARGRIAGMRSSLGIVLALALAAAGCIGGDGGAGDGAPSPASPPEAPVSPPEDLETGVGVTEEPCPQAESRDHGCIYLGALTDVDNGPFAPLGRPFTDGQQAFWERVNRQGGIAGFDVDAATYQRDTAYEPEAHAEALREIESSVLALAQSFGTPPTSAIHGALSAGPILTTATSWSSAWAFSDVVLGAGANQCVQGMHAVDWLAEHGAATPTGLPPEGEGDQGEEEPAPIEQIVVVHYKGDFGDDVRVGAQEAAARHAIEVVAVPTEPGAREQDAAVAEIVAADPDALVVAVGPAELAAIVGRSGAQGVGGLVMGTTRSWDPGLLETPAAEALQTRFRLVAPWLPWRADSAGHAAVREALTDAGPHEERLAGWTLQYPLSAVLERAAADGALTREGLSRAAERIEAVDFEGILPPEAGRQQGPPAARAFRAAAVLGVDPAAPTTLETVDTLSIGATADAAELDRPCFAR